MNKKTPSEKQAELDRLRDRIVITLEFVASREDFPNVGDFKSLAEGAHARGDLRALQIIARDLDKATIGLMSHDRDGLEAILQQRLGIDKNAERAELQQQVAIALKRGTIAGEKERRRLEDYAEMLEATGGDPAEIAAVRRLVNTG